MSSTSPNTGQFVERERRQARPVAIASILAVLLYIGSIVLEQAAGLLDRDNDATRLNSFNDNATALLGTSVMLALGVALLSVPLYYLFKAAQDRSDKVRGALIAFCFIGPLLFGIQAIVSWFALSDVAQQFVDMNGGANDELAEDLIDDSGTLDFATSLVFPAILGLLVAMIYVPLMAMRNGLLTRFFGTLGMALGASLALFPPIALLGILFWFLYIGLMIGGWLPGPKPPAWESGKSEPWPVPESGPGLFGGRRGRDQSVVQGSGKEVDVGGEAGGRELSEPPLPEAGDATDATETDGTETQGQRRKKRKRR